MSEPEHEPTPAERVDDLPRIQRALRLAVQDALRLHRLQGHRVVIWRNGRVEWIEPEDIPLFPDDDGRAETDGPGR